jgi:hypothetical protein
MTDRPEDQQKLIISVNGIYYDAVYHKSGNYFRTVKFTPICFDPTRFKVYWCELTSPE